MTQELELSRILRLMGDSPSDVVATLRSRTIQGVRNTVRFFNPIVRFVEAELGVGPHSLDVIQPNVLRLTLPDHSTHETTLPLPVREFLEAFNRGEFPELELPAEHT